MDIRKFWIGRVNIKTCKSSIEKLKVNNYVEKKKIQSLCDSSQKEGGIIFGYINQNYANIIIKTVEHHLMQHEK